MRIEGIHRKALALTLLAAIGLLSWRTMDPGRPRELVLVLMAAFAVKIVLTGTGSRYHRREGGDGSDASQE